MELDPDDFGDFSSAFATTTVQERELDPSTVASDVVGDGTILNPCDAVPLQAPESSPYTLDWEFADFSSPLVHSNGQFPDIPSLPEDLVFLSGTRENFDSQTASKTCAVLCLHGHEESLQHTKESDTSVGETYLDVSLSHNRSHPTCTNVCVYAQVVCNWLYVSDRKGSRIEAVEKMTKTGVILGVLKLQQWTQLRHRWKVVLQIQLTSVQVLVTMARSVRCMVFRLLHIFFKLTNGKL